MSVSLSARSTPSPPAVSLSGVVKRFGPIEAVAGLDLEVPGGSCFGLLGPNGAGKSTTMRMLTGQALPDAGLLEVLGLALPAEAKLARARMGVVPQVSNLDADLTVRENLEVFAALYRVPRADRAQAIERALELSGLGDRQDSRADELSGGMQRRLLIARALIHGPELVLLDEPTVGLDPQVRQRLWSLIAGLADAGTTVLMSTHYIEEAERLADRVAIMASGRVVAEGAPAELVARHAGRDAIEVAALASKILDTIGKEPLYYTEIAERFCAYDFRTVARALGHLHATEKLWQDPRGRMCVRGSAFAAKPPSR